MPDENIKRSTLIDTESSLTEIDKRLGAGADVSLLQTILLDDMAVALRSIRKSLEGETFIGKKKTIIINSTSAENSYRLLDHDPYHALITANIHNDGPNSVFLSINNDSDWSEMRNGENLVIDFKDAKEKIIVIGYRCNPAQTAVLRIIGKY